VAPCTWGAQRSEYASCTLSHQRCDSLIAEPSSSVRTFAAESCCPRSGRSLWIWGRKLFADPCSASIDWAQAMSAAFASPLDEVAVSAIACVVCSVSRCSRRAAATVAEKIAACEPWKPRSRKPVIASMIRPEAS